MILDIGKVLRDRELDLMKSFYKTSKDAKWSYDKKFKTMSSMYRLNILFNSKGEPLYNDPENDYGVAERVLEDLVSYKLATDEIPLILDKYPELYPYLDISVIRGYKDCNKLRAHHSILNEDKFIVSVDYISHNENTVSLINAYKLIGQFLDTYSQ